MIDLNNVRSLSEFQRNAKEHIRRLKKTGRPEVLTVNGQAEVIVQSASAYQKMLDELEFVRTIKGIQRGLEQARRGESRPMRQFLDELAAEHGVDLKE